MSMLLSFLSAPKHERITLERSDIECHRCRNCDTETGARDPHPEQPGKTHPQVGQDFSLPSHQHQTAPYSQREGTPRDRGRAKQTVGKSEKPEEVRQPGYGNEERIRQLEELALDAKFSRTRCIWPLALCAIYPCVTLLGEQEEKDAR